ncbi:MAG: YchF/TatD family DNA exonuclease [Bacteroidetes bacterium]|nr:YchF/TatD family DNA exonuclease [Bacteroidota bacterium]
MLVDTHTHLYLPEFDTDRTAIMERAMAVGVNEFYLPAIDSRVIESMLKMEEAYPGQVHAMMGLHPCSVKEDYTVELEIVKNWLDKRPFCAIGEIGIDLYWEKSTLDIQIDAFRTQINWAKNFDVPIVIHSRESTELILDILKDEKHEKLRGILHCFTGTAEQAETAFSLGFHLGIGGVVTFKNAGLDKIVSDIPLEWLVLETDSPYLAPVPYRGKRNESAFIRLVAEKVASIKSVDLEEVAKVTTMNSKNIFQKITWPYTTLS